MVSKQSKAKLKLVKTISVITPSFNQAKFLPACLESVQKQTFKPIEHLVFDPGSSDGSQEIAGDHPFAELIDEPDEGQADAVSKGFSRAKGDVIAWLNSDDEYYDENVFSEVMERFNQSDQPDIVYGLADYTDEEGNILRPVSVHKRPDELDWRLPESVGISQPATFIRRSLAEKIGGPEKTLHFGMDYEYWIRAHQSGAKFVYLDKKLANSRYYNENKTSGQRDKSLAEVCKLLKSRYGYVSINWIRQLAENLTEGFDGILTSSSTSAYSKDKVELKISELLKAYNGDYDTRQFLKENCDARPMLDTWWAMIDRKLHADKSVVQVPTIMNSKSGYRFYNVGPRRFAYQKSIVSTQTQRTRDYLDTLSRDRQSDTCIIIGNGPSLNHTKLEYLDNVESVFGANYAYIHKELEERINYLSIVNYLVAEQGSHDFNLVSNAKVFIPFWLMYCINPRNNVYFFNSVGKPEFSKNANENVSWRSTVTFFQMQIAYHIGYKRVLLVGFDHNYPHQPDLKEGEVIDQKDDDHNHFDPAYFRGKKWQAADVGLMEEMYKLAKHAYEEDGREIINCTVGGKLDLFRRSDLKSELSI